MIKTVDREEFNELPDTLCLTCINAHYTKCPFWNFEIQPETALEKVGAEAVKREVGVGVYIYKVKECPQYIKKEERQISEAELNELREAYLKKLAKKDDGKKRRYARKDNTMAYDIRRLYNEEGVKVGELARMFNCTAMNIRNILTGKTWKKAGGNLVKKGERKNISMLNDQTVAEIKQKLRENVKNVELAKNYKVSLKVISDIKTGRTYRNVV
jgi:Mor family transcriptional regulator